MQCSTPSKGHLQLKLVSQRDVIRSRPRNFRLQHLPATVYRPRANPSQAESAPLVEPKCLKVVVRGDHPQTPTARVPGNVLDSGEQRGTDTQQPGRGVQRQELAVVSIDHVRGSTPQFTLRPGQHGRVIQ